MSSVCSVQRIIYLEFFLDSTSPLLPVCVGIVWILSVFRPPTSMWTRCNILEVLTLIASTRQYFCHVAESYPCYFYPPFDLIHLLNTTLPAARMLQYITGCPYVAVHYRLPVCCSTLPAARMLQYITGCPYVAVHYRLPVCCSTLCFCCWQSSAQSSGTRTPLQV